jgi:hypothetical protein
MKKRFRIIAYPILILIGFVSIAQTPDQKKMMEEILRKQDSVMNTPQMKEMIQKMENMQESMSIENSSNIGVKNKEVKNNPKKSSNNNWYWENTIASENNKFIEWTGGPADIVMAYKGPNLKTFKIGSIKEDGTILFNLPSSVITKTTFERQIGPQGLFLDIYGDVPVNYSNKETGFITNVSLLVMRNEKPIGNLTMGNSVKVTKDLTSQNGVSSGNEGYIVYWAYSNESCSLVLDQDWTGNVRKDGTNTVEVKTNVKYNLQFKPGWNLIKTEVIGKYTFEHEHGLDVSWFKTHKHTVVSSIPTDVIYYFRSIASY